MPIPATLRRSLAIAGGTLALAASPGAAQDSAATHQGPRPPARATAAADLAFVRGMIHHHAQAIEMSALIATRTTRRELHLLGERITVSQRDEIAMMEQWLRDHGPSTADSALGGRTPPVAHAGHAAHEAPDALMPGMLTPAEMRALAAASGTAFDRRFLEGMIQHHQGALSMVRALLAQPGAARQPQLYEFASDIDADQRAEIARMRALLAALPPE